MKIFTKTLLTIILFFSIQNIIAQISTHIYLNVPAENRVEFERLEMEYWSKVAKKRIEAGKMNGWGLLRTVGVDDVTHVIVNTFSSVEQALDNSGWNPSVIGMDGREINTSSLRKVLANVQYQNETSINSDEATNFTVFNYGNPESVGAFISEQKNIWKGIIEKNRSKTNLTSWGAHTRIHPKGNSMYSSVWTRDGFKTLADAMNYLRYSENNPYQSMAKNSKMDKIMPQGFKKIVIRETLMWVN
jgi:hypothetical protein